MHACAMSLAIPMQIVFHESFLHEIFNFCQFAKVSLNTVSNNVVLARKGSRNVEVQSKYRTVWHCSNILYPGHSSAITL